MVNTQKSLQCSIFEQQIFYLKNLLCDFESINHNIASRTVCKTSQMSEVFLNSNLSVYLMWVFVCQYSDFVSIYIYYNYTISNTPKYTNHSVLSITIHTIQTKSKVLTVYYNFIHILFALP